MLLVEEDRVVRCDGVKIKPPAAKDTALVSAVFARAQWSGFVDQSKQSAQAHAPLGLDAPGGGLLHARRTRTLCSIKSVMAKLAGLPPGE